MSVIAWNVLGLHLVPWVCGVCEHLMGPCIGFVSFLSDKQVKGKLMSK